MTRKILKYFLLLSVTLLIGYAQLFAEANTSGTLISIEQHNETDGTCSLVKEQRNVPFSFDYVHTSFLIDTYKIQAIDIEIEEDEVSHSKKQLEFVNYFSSVLYNIKNSDLRVFIRKKTFFSNALSNFSLNKLFIVFNVFRI